jgi:hypothetical protein
MTTKREIENIERIILGMSERQYWGLVGWLSSGGNGALWDCVKPYRYQQDEDQRGAA